MKIYTSNQQHDGAFGLAKRICIHSFRQVSVFGDNYTKIIYMHSPTSFSIEKVGDNVDLDENVQVVSGPRAEEIITEMIELEKMKGSTFVWSGARYDNTAVINLHHDESEVDKLFLDPLVNDMVETENDRKTRKRSKRGKENDYEDN